MTVDIDNDTVETLDQIELSMSASEKGLMKKAALLESCSITSSTLTGRSFADRARSKFAGNKMPISSRPRVGLHGKVARSADAAMKRKIAIQLQILQEKKKEVVAAIKDPFEKDTRFGKALERNNQRAEAVADKLVGTEKLERDPNKKRMIATNNAAYQ